MPAGFPVLATAASGAAVAAYINAKLRLSHDLHTLKAAILTTRQLTAREKAGRLNPFYLLEGYAQDPKIADHTSLIYEDKHWTYKQFYDIVLRYAGWLRATHNVVAGEIIALDFMNCPEFLFLVVALWSLNASPAMINCNLTGKALIHSVKISTARLLILDPEVAERVLTDEVRTTFLANDFRNSTFPLEYLVFDHGLQTSMNYFPPYRAPDSVLSTTKPGDVAALIYTSGTTGFPKAAIIPVQRINGAASVTCRLLSLQPVTSKKPDVFYTCMPLYHTTAFTLGFCTCLFGPTTFAIGRKFSVSSFWPEVRRNNVTVIQYVGETLRYLLAAPPSPDDRNHNVRMAWGNGLRSDVWSRFKTRFNVPTVFEIYGATEGFQATLNLNRNSFSDGAIGSYGTILQRRFFKAQTIVKVDWETEKPWRDPKTGLCQVMPRGEVGELMALLDPSMPQYRGYLGNKDASEGKIVRDVLVKGDAYFRSGDVVKMDKDGRLWFSDRIGDTFRWRSENVSTAEVGDVIGRHPDVDEANVYGVKVPGHEGRAGCAALLLKDEALQGGKGSVTPRLEVLESLATYASNSLPKYAVPLFVRVVRQVTLTGNNKQQKVALRNQGIDLRAIKAADSPDKMYWLKPGGGKYIEFKQEDYTALEASKVKL